MYNMMAYMLNIVKLNIVNNALWRIWKMLREQVLKVLLRRKKFFSVTEWGDWCWSWSSNTLATWYKELTYWERPWCWERLKAGEGDDRGWDGWMQSPTQWAWVWASSGRWWRTGNLGVLQSMGSQRVDTTDQLSGTKLMKWWMLTKLTAVMFAIYTYAIVLYT